MVAVVAEDPVDLEDPVVENAEFPRREKARLFALITKRSAKKFLSLEQISNSFTRAKEWPEIHRAIRCGFR